MMMTELYSPAEPNSTSNYEINSQQLSRISWSNKGQAIIRHAVTLEHQVNKPQNIDNIIFIV